MRKIVSLLAAAAALSLAAPAAAQQVTFSSSFIAGNYSPLNGAPALPPGTQLNGSGAYSILYDPSTSNLSLTSFVFDIGGNHFDLTNSVMASTPAGAGYFNILLGGAAGTAIAGCTALCVDTSLPDFLLRFSLDTSTGSAGAMFQQSYSNGSGGSAFYQTGSGGIRFSATSMTAAVPEPATWAMMLVGFGGIGFAMRRKHTTSMLPKAA